MIIFDLDHTLFNTTILKEDFKKIFLKHGLTPEEFEKTFYEAYDLEPEAKICYHFNKQLLLLSRFSEAEKEQIRKELIESLKQRGQQLLYEDVLPVLSELKANKQKIILITHGDERFQRLKLEVSGLKDYFDEVYIVQKDKVSIVKKIDLSGKIFNINDHFEELAAIKRSFPKVENIFLLRPDRKKTGVISEFPSFTSLSETMKYIKEKMR